MAFWTCGFEGGDLQYYEDLGWSFDIDVRTAITSLAGEVHASLAGRGGTYGLVVGDVATSPAFGYGGRWLHFWLQGVAGVTSGVTFVGAGVSTYSISFTGAGLILQRRGSTTSTITAAGGYSAAVGHWIAIEMEAAQSPDGFCNVYVDGVLAVSFSGDTQASAGSSGWNQILIDPSNNTSRAVDDLIITTEEEGRLGEHFLPRMALAGNDSIGSGAGSTGGTGTYANVDEIPPDEGTSYNEFTSTGTDRYTTTNLGYTPASIHCVTVLGQAARDGTITQGQTVAASDSGGSGVTEALGAVSGLGAAGVYAAWQDSFNTDPDTSTAIAEANTGTDFFGIAGDVASDILVGSIVTVTGSTANDGDWIVESVAFNTPNTEIVVTGTLVDATADGTITYNWTGAALDDLRVGVKFS